MSLLDHSNMEWMIVLSSAVIELPSARLALDNAADFMSTRWRR